MVRRFPSFDIKLFCAAYFISTNLLKTALGSAIISVITDILLYGQEAVDPGPSPTNQMLMPLGKFLFYATTALDLARLYYASVYIVGDDFRSSRIINAPEPTLNIAFSRMYAALFSRRQDTTTLLPSTIRPASSPQ